MNELEWRRAMECLNERLEEVARMPGGTRGKREALLDVTLETAELIKKIQVLDN